MNWFFFITSMIIFLLTIGFRIFSTIYNKDRVIYFLVSKGYKVRYIKWAPFAYGFFLNERNNDIYLVEYIDKQGILHSAYCKTTLFTDVFIGNDNILEEASALEKKINDV